MGFLSGCLWIFGYRCVFVIVRVIFLNILLGFIFSLKSQPVRKNTCFRCLNWFYFILFYSMTYSWRGFYFVEMAFRIWMEDFYWILMTVLMIIVNYGITPHWLVYSTHLPTNRMHNTLILSKMKQKGDQDSFKFPINIHKKEFNYSFEPTNK